jgi:hypothetical protein
MITATSYIHTPCYNHHLPSNSNSNSLLLLLQQHGDAGEAEEQQQEQEQIGQSWTRISDKMGVQQNVMGFLSLQTKPKTKRYQLEDHQSSLSLSSPLSEPSPDSFSLRLSHYFVLSVSFSLSLSLSLFLSLPLFEVCVCVDEATNSTVLLSFLPWEYYVGGGPWCTVIDTGACTARDWRISRGFNAKLIIIIMLEYIYIDI